MRGPRYWQQQLDRSSTAGYNSSTAAAAQSVIQHTSAPAVTPAHMATGHALLTPMLPVDFPAAIAGRQKQRSDPGSTNAFQPTPGPLHAAPPPGMNNSSWLGSGCDGDAQSVDVRCADGVSSLHRTYAQQLLFVKKKCSSLSYADDPSGIRSLLSRTFHTRRHIVHPDAAASASSFDQMADWQGARDGSAGCEEDGDDGSGTETSGTGLTDSGGRGLDVANLCATFSLDPFLMAFAQHVQQLAVLQGERAGEKRCFFVAGFMGAEAFLCGCTLHALGPVSRNRIWFQI